MRPLSELICDYMIPWETMAWPLDLDAVFGRSAPLAIEVGFGDGAYMEKLAASQPDTNFLAIDVSWSPIHRLFARLEREGLKNVKIIRSDAHFVLERLVQNTRADEIIVNHPDPWRKERHHERRLIQGPFLALVAQVLKQKSTLRIATDHAEYADWIEAALEAQNDLVSSLSTTRVAELPGHFVTRYERKAREQGIGNHFYIWHKAVPDTPERPQEELEDMPNVSFRGACDLDQLMGQFEPQVFREVHDQIDVVIRFERAFREHDAGNWMVETMIREGRLTQHVGLVMILGEESPGLTLKSSIIGFPRATHGLKQALRYLAGIVERSQPSLKVDTSTVGSTL